MSQLKQIDHCGLVPIPFAGRSIVRQRIAETVLLCLYLFCFDKPAFPRPAGSEKMFNWKKYQSCYLCTFLSLLLLLEIYFSAHNVQMNRNKCRPCFMKPNRPDGLIFIRIILLLLLRFVNLPQNYNILNTLKII